MQKTREQQVDELVKELMQSCPYEYNSKLYWIYNAGLMSTIVKRLAVIDYALARDLAAIAERNNKKKNF